MIIRKPQGSRGLETEIPMCQLNAKAREEIRRFLEEANGLWLMYLRFAETLEHFARNYGMWGVGAVLRDLESHVLNVMRHMALKSLGRTAGFGVCFEEDPSCEVIVLNGRGPYRLFDTERIRIRTRDGRYVDEYLL